MPRPPPAASTTAVTAASSTSPATTSDRFRRRTAVRAARLFDGLSTAPVADPLVVEDGRIGAVDAGLRAPVPPGADVIDLPGAALLPGLVDAHVHLVFDAGPDTALAGRDDDAVLAGGRRADRRHPLHPQRHHARPRYPRRRGAAAAGAVGQRVRGRWRDPARRRRAQRRGRRRRRHPGRGAARRRARLPVRRPGRGHVLVPLPPGLARAGRAGPARRAGDRAQRRHRSHRRRSPAPRSRSP
jgi:Predicted metal-dependent hydrolase with the TIM-barrel fold